MPAVSPYARPVARLVLLGSALTALAGCPGTTTSTTTTTPSTTTTPTTTVATTATRLEFGVPSGETLPTASYDPVADTWEVTDGTNTITLTRSAAVDINGFQAYGTGANYLWYAESPSGDVGAAFGATDPSVTGSYSVGGIVGRASDGTIPTGGTASYTGSYGSLLQSQTDPRTANVLLSGDAALTANFDAGTVSGEITNRTAAGAAFADLTLSPTSIGSNATFSGSATGGEYDPSGAAPGTTSGATYTGLFGGDNGDEVAVGVQVEHVIGSGAYFETGAFIGTQ